MSRKLKSQYETDFYAWALETAKLIRAHKFAEIDVENVAEEIESMGRSERHELVSRLVILICHILKWHFQPGRQGKSWRKTIVDQRTEIGLLLEDNPSLQRELDLMLSRAYKAGRIKAASETGLLEKVFPMVCPYTMEQLLDYHFLPESEQFI